MPRLCQASVVELYDSSGRLRTALRGEPIEPSAAELTRAEALGPSVLAPVNATKASIASSIKSASDAYELRHKSGSLQL